MEVGCVSNEYVLNPSNPTQAISYGGMNFLTDNGIYSGIYFPRKAMLGTPDESAVIQDATAIETFVMVVINNYAAAGDARSITQIKFAVTNGRVFSMEKRTSYPGSTYVASEWESVGGGLPARVSFDLSGPDNRYYFGYSNAASTDLSLGSGVAIGDGVKIGRHVKIGNEVDVKGSSIDTAIIQNAIIVSDSGNIQIDAASINDDNFSTRFDMENADINFSYKFDGPPSAPGYGYFTTHINSEFGIIEFSSVEGSRGINIYDTNIFFSKTDSDGVIIRTKLPYGLTIEPSEDGSKLLLSYNGKTAELPLTEPSAT
jgi:hypothetical protein